MQSGEARQRGCRLVGDGVVLHGAAAQRIELLADRVVQRGHAAVVAHDLGLAETRQVGRMRTERIFRERVLRCWSLHTCGRQTRRLGAWAAELEGKRLGHALRASTSWSIAAGSLTSVQVNVRTPLSSRNQRPT